MRPRLHRPPRQPLGPPAAATAGIASILLLAALSGDAATATATTNAAATTRAPWGSLLRATPEELRSEASRTTATNLLAHQTARGDWPKNLDTTRPLPSPGPGQGRDAGSEGTWDNEATVREVRWLAKYHAATGDPRSAAAVERSLAHILGAQYPTGGWPQRHPPGNGYARHITFNDGTQVHLLELLVAASESPDFAWLPASTKDSARRAVQRGIDCILRCQVRIDGRQTVWCAQHDAVTLEPRPARSFEPAALSGAESAGVLRFLMRHTPPTPDHVEAVKAGVDWFRRHALRGLRVVDAGGDRRVVEDPSAPEIWARFIDPVSGKPVFSGRDGIPRDRLADIEQERRVGYAWYGGWGAGLDREFAAWRAAR